MSDMSRRDFVTSSSRTAVGLTAAGAVLASRNPVRGTPPSETVQIAAIGVGGRGSSLARGFASRPDCVITQIVDLDPTRGGNLRKQLGDSQGKTPERILDYRRALDSKDSDAVTVATPDHWHGPMSIYACQAGKDVYVEKPPSHNVWEGRQMVNAARRYNRIVQAGTQNRSAPYVHQALEIIRSGEIGNVHLCKVYNLKNGGPGGGPYKEPADSPLPEDLDYDTWLGPAPKRSFNRGHFHGSWHHYWRYSGGDLADDGIHQLDIARWLCGVGFPKSVSGMGGRFEFDDDNECPDTQAIQYEFPGLVMTFELLQAARYMTKTNGQIRGGNRFPHWAQNATRIEFYGTKNLLVLGRHGGGWQIFKAGGEVVKEQFGRFPDPPHKENFIQSIKSRTRPNADIEEGHRSATLVHLGNIATRLSCRFTFDADEETIPDHDAARSLLKRDYREPFTIPDLSPQAG